jgi:hypothetical protein
MGVEPPPQDMVYAIMILCSIRAQQLPLNIARANQIKASSSFQSFRAKYLFER